MRLWTEFSTAFNLMGPFVSFHLKRTGRLSFVIHQGVFGGHLKNAKVHSELSKHYWWRGMRSDITQWCRACLICATRQPSSRAVKPPLTPIPVSGPFDRLGVDIIRFPKSHNSKPICNCVYGLTHKVARGLSHSRPDSSDYWPTSGGEDNQPPWGAFGTSLR